MAFRASHSATGNQMAPTVTIALPVFNGGESLQLAVASILSQSFSDWELLIIDDGSTDQAVTKLTVTDPRVRVLADRRNLGLSRRLNQAIELAQGTFFARMDHDDVAHPDRLRQQVDRLREYPDIDLLGTQCVVIDEGGSVIGQLPGEVTHEQICARPWLGFHLPHPTWMGRTAWFRKYLYAVPGPYRCEDQELLLRGYAASHYEALPGLLLAYRVRRRTKLSVLVRTRLALAAVQCRFFARNSRFVFALLASAAAVVRVLSDLVRSLSRTAPGVQTTSPEMAAMWGKILSSLERRAN